MRETNKRAIGKRGEEVAIQYLLKQGVLLLDQNFYFSGGEIDLIVKDGEYICFIEVKYRTNTKLGYPSESVGITKQRKIRFGARQYLYRHHQLESTPCRFDVISIIDQEITWIKNAF